MLSIICPGCKEKINDENTMAVPSKPTPGQENISQKKEVTHHKARFYRKWEE